MSNAARYATALALSFFTAASPAALVTYDFSVSAATGPLAGQSATGFLSFDASIIVPGGVVSATNLFVDFGFTWNGITYDESTANTGGLVFDTSGLLVDAVFGNDCIPGWCFSGATQEEWWVRMLTNEFVYNVPPGPSSRGTASLHLRTNQIPEPATLSLAAAALLLLGMSSRRRP